VVDIIPGGVGPIWGGPGGPGAPKMGGPGWSGWGGRVGRVGIGGLGSEAGEDDSPKATQERMRLPFQLRCYV